MAVGFSYTNLPPGVTYSSATGDITGTPTYEAAGTYSITLTVSDGRLQATHGFVWTVNDINRAPLLDDLGVIFVNEGSQTDLTLAFSDPDNHNLSVTVNSVATFVTATPNPDGTITLTIAPGTDDARSASYPVIVNVADTQAAPLTTSKTLQIGVIEDSGATHVVQLSSGYGDFKLELYGAVAPQAVSAFLTLVSTGDLEGSLADHIGFPTQRPILQGGGLRLEGSQWDRVNEGGVLASEPGIAHEYGTVALTSAPGLWPNFSRSQWFINPADNSSALSSATQTVFGRVVDGFPVISAIANTPIYNASASDFAGIGRAEESTLTQLPLMNASIPILLNGVVELSAYARPCTLIGIAGEPFQSEFPLPVGLTAPYTYAINSGALPSGVTLDPATGIISGVASAGGSYPFSYTMTDALSAQANANCAFIVNSPPVVQMIADQSNEEGESVSMPVLATDADPGSVLTDGVGSGHPLPQGVNIDPVTRCHVRGDCGGQCGLLHTGGDGFRFIQRVHQGDDNARAGSADGMAERASTAVHVDFVRWQVEIAHGGHGDAGERFVDFEQIHLARAPAGLVQQLADSAHRRGGKPGRFVGMGGVRDDARPWRHTPASGFALAHHHKGGGAVGDGAGVGRRDGSRGAESRLQARDLVDAGLARLLVVLDGGFTFAGFNADRHHLGGEGAVVYGGVGPAQGADGEFVLGFAGELIRLRRVFGERAHQPAFVISVFQPVQEQMIDDFAMAHAHTASRAIQQIGRVGHAFHAACHHHLIAAGFEQIMGQHDRFHARAAHLVDGGAAGG
ncbi:MAG: hypothetical protein GKR94_19850 [Gammaproteobacteria bacterium]|nr:hypothetical protein [Gammaproteobacteria bacterium]